MGEEKTGGGCGRGTPTEEAAAAAECGDEATSLCAGEATPLPPPPPLGLAKDPGRLELRTGMPVTLWRVRGLDSSCSDTFRRWRACASMPSPPPLWSDAGEEGAPIDSFFRLVILKGAMKLSTFIPVPTCL